jgi:hypothetical protein
MSLSLEPPPGAASSVTALTSVVMTTDVVEDRPEAMAWPRSWVVRGWYGVCYALEWLFGLASMLVCLAVLAAVPILNFISLGYLLEASGRVANSGRLRDGFVDIGKFSRIGSLVAGTWLCLLVPRLISSLASDAWLIDPESTSARNWRIAQIGVTVVVLSHVLAAWYCGGRLRHFFWPVLAPFQLAGRLVLGRVIGPVARPMIAAMWPALAADLYVERPLVGWFPPAILLEGLRRRRMYVEARDAVWEFVVSLRLAERFWLGLRGFVGGLLWLILPSLMLMAGTWGRGGGVAILIGYAGALALAVVVLYLPFLQTQFARQNRFLAMFEVREIRAQFNRAPLAYWFALLVTLLFALPLYLLKIEPVIPPELQWMITLFFVVFIYPARLLTGWAMGRAIAHVQPRFFVFRWLARAAVVPVVLLYVLILFFTQYTSFLGPASLLEQHAFLLPVPFLAM